MSFDPLEYERTGGNYGLGEDPAPESTSLEIWRTTVDPSSAFARDLGILVATAARVEEQERADLVEELPADHIFRTNVTFDVLGWGFMFHKVKQGVGYHIARVGPAADRDHGIVNASEQAAEYQLSGEATPSITTLHHIPEFALVTTIADVTPYPHAYLLDTGDHPYSLYNEARVAPLRDSGLLERGFMFATLRSAAKYLLKPKDTAGRHASDMLLSSAAQVLEMYEDLAAEGVSPLGLEEIYGIMATAVRVHIGEHPELGPLPEPLA